MIQVTKLQKWMWKYIISTICKFIAKQWTKSGKYGALISFPLFIAISLGNVKYIYYKYGIMYTINYCLTFNKVIAGNMLGANCIHSNIHCEFMDEEEFEDYEYSKLEPN